ncbi:MAG: tetratricopeptide repeat protein [Candidatus Aminicenantes bacterium]|nr:tetratricopeptide repeat protein [Candidatus Aminicenantes bacterium]
MGKKLYLAFFIVLGIFALFVQAQQMDPFYQRLINEGETQFQEGRYAKAVQTLKVAVFGIEGHPDILGKAHVYLGLSYYYLNQESNSENHLRKAVQLLGTDGLSTIPLEPGIRSDLSKIFSYLGILQEQSQSKPEELRESESPISDVTQQNRIQQLKTAVKDQPDQTQAYYDLYEIYLQQGRSRKARDILEKLSRRHALESRALYLLGVNHFKKRRFKKAQTYFSRIFALAQSMDVASEITDSSHAYQILSFYYQGQKDRAYQWAESREPGLTEEKVGDMGLEERDQRVLLEILNK